MTPEPTNKENTNAAIEKTARDLSNKIWNQNGKHTHNELDVLIRESLHQFAAEIETEAYERGKADELSFWVKEMKETKTTCNCKSHEK